MILGVDPSQRHTGLCLLGANSPIFHEIRTGGLDLLSSIQLLKEEFSYFLNANRGSIEAYAIEKQLSVGARSSSLLFHVQMTILDLIVSSHPEARDPKLIMPLPIQLQSYIRQQHNFTGLTDSGLVDHFKKQENFQGRISIHCVDAYYMARLGRDVLDGNWKYKLPEKEVPLTPHKIINGD